MSLPKECPIGPERKRRKRTPRKNLEGVVIRECLKALRQCPQVVYVERRNTGAVLYQGGGFVRFGRVGAADIWCLVRVPLRIMNAEDEVVCTLEDFHLTHVEIECKRADGHGHLSPDQRRFKEFCGSHGIPYILTTSAQELMAKIKGDFS